MKNASQHPQSIVTGLIVKLGQLCGWLLLALIALQFIVVVARYLFSTNFLWAQELVVYLHASIILCAISWTLLENKHVRLDVLSNALGRKGRTVVEILGTLLFLIPFMLVILHFSRNYVLQSWTVFEGSAELSGLPGVFLIKTLIPIFALLVLLAGGRIVRKRLRS